MSPPDDLPASRRSAKMQKYSAPALEKGLEILEFLSLQSQSSSMQQIASGVGRNKNEIFRMMIVLEESGYIDRRDADNFSLTDKLYHLGLRRPANRRIADIALPHMDVFSRIVPLCCYLIVAAGDEVVTIAKAESLDAYTFSVAIGHRDSILNSAEGLCLLAHMQTARRERLFHHLGLAAAQASSVLDDLATMRRAGSFVRENAFVRGVTNIAAPIFDEEGGAAIAALSVPFVEIKGKPLPVAQVQYALREAAEAINFELWRRPSLSAKS